MMTKYSSHLPAGGVTIHPRRSLSGSGRPLAKAGMRRRPVPLTRRSPLFPLRQRDGGLAVVLRRVLPRRLDDPPLAPAGLAGRLRLAQAVGAGAGERAGVLQLPQR